jgi:hypothetical protein
MNAKTLAVLVGLIVSAGLAAAAELRERAPGEIAYLFVHLRMSGCEFYRNGSWYDSKRAEAHLRRKYEYLLKKGLVSTAESFIEQAATQSSVSGKAYQVRCAGQPAEESGPWFRRALGQHRAMPSRLTP